MSVLLLITSCAIAGRESAPDAVDLCGADRPYEPACPPETAIDSCVEPPIAVVTSPDGEGRYDGRVNVFLPDPASTAPRIAFDASEYRFPKEGNTLLRAAFAATATHDKSGLHVRLPAEASDESDCFVAVTAPASTYIAAGGGSATCAEMSAIGVTAAVDLSLQDCDLVIAVETFDGATSSGNVQMRAQPARVTWACGTPDTACSAQQLSRFFDLLR